MGRGQARTAGAKLNTLAELLAGRDKLARCADRGNPSRHSSRV